jgi:catalase
MKKSDRSAPAKAASRSSTARPSQPASDTGGDPLAEQAAQTQELVASMPFNKNKAAEYVPADATQPPAGQTAAVPQPVGASTLSENNASPKTSDGEITIGRNATIGTLDRVRADGSGQPLTTNQGVLIADNQNSLKAGLRGPTLLEDFILREKITHFDHERIPERIVHARGSAAHGYFECYEPMTKVTRAAPFSEAGKRTPVFTRFSTVAGGGGSADTARDVRGFAVKFYTDEGNWDIVGNNIPVFFIQDAIKFPDLVHAVKPEPHNGIPQAASAHDTFWDFASLMPESTHMLMWVMSDRAIPRSLRMMQGFGVHTFRLINEAGESTFVKFHWTPKLGTHSLVWDEAVKISGADSDFHRRDLWEAIEAGEYPEWELAFQMFTEEQAEGFSFDVLDSTKLIPEELVPLTPVGRMVLDRNPDNFFAETEQVAFGTGHVVPGIDFSNDPLLAGRHHSYLDTQLSRLGGPNFHEIPINAPIAPSANNQRDGIHRQAIHRGRVSYEPNSLAGGCPFQAGVRGFVSFPQPMQEDKVRGKPEKFAEHYAQARLFFNSQTAAEKAHIVAAFRFELSKLTVPAIRERMLSSLVNVSDELAGAIADGLGMEVPAAMPRALATEIVAELETAPSLSLMARPGDGGIRTRKIAILVADGVVGESVAAMQSALLAAGAVPKLIAPKLGSVKTTDGSELQADGTLENSAPVLFDAVVLADGEASVKRLAGLGQAVEFVVNQGRHGKTILALGAGEALLQKAGVSPVLASGDPDPGVIVGDRSAVDRFIEAVGRHRHVEREMDPPLV